MFNSIFGFYRQNEIRIYLIFLNMYNFGIKYSVHEKNLILLLLLTYLFVGAILGSILIRRFTSNNVEINMYWMTMSESKYFNALKIRFVVLFYYNIVKYSLYFKLYRGVPKVGCDKVTFF